MKKIFITLLICCVIVIAHAQIFVTPAGSGAKNGTSWGDAYDAQQLRNVMATATGGSEFWIAAGTYKPAVIGRDSSFIIPVDIHVYGGFNGTETTLSERDWVHNITIFSGDIGITGDSTDNTYHVVTLKNNTKQTIIDGITICNGNAINGTEACGNCGGGMYITGGTDDPYASYKLVRPTIINCTFRNNTARDHGGAVYNTATSGNTVMGPHFTNCIFQDNNTDTITSFGGGAVYTLTGIGENTLDSYYHCTFIGNTSYGVGGAMYIDAEMGNNYTGITQCTFTHNATMLKDSVSPGGVDYVFNDGNTPAVALKITAPNPYTTPTMSASIDSCIFDGNKFLGNAGDCSAISLSFFDPYTTPITPVIHIAHSTFTNDSGGSAVIVCLFNGPELGDTAIQAHVYVQNCAFSHNMSGQATISTGMGGGCQDSVFITNCSFYDNNIGNVSNNVSENCAMYMQFANNSSLMLPNFTYGQVSFTNIANSYLGVPYLQVDIENSIFWHHAVPVIVPIIYNTGTTSYIHCNIKNSIIETEDGTFSSAMGSDLGGNKFIYPQFSDTLNGNLTLRCGSPAINAGDNASINDIATMPDLADNNRINQDTVDIGAFEYYITTPLAAGMVNLIDSTLYCTNESTSDEDSLVWTFGDGTTSNYYDPIHTYTASGAYNVCLNVYACGAHSDTCLTVTVTIDTTTTTSVNNTTSINTSIFPNPFTQTITVTGTPQNTTLRIYDINGRQVYNTAPVSGKQTINTSLFAPGLYLLQTIEPNGKVNAFKILKQ